MYGHMHTCSGVWKSQTSMPSVFLNRPPPYSLEMESHTAPDFTVLAKWLAGELQRAACLPLPTLQLQVGPLYLALFYFFYTVVLRIQTQILMLEW